MNDDPFDPVAGRVDTLRNGLRRILAPNPSPMTHRGTNTYLIGTRQQAVIDPGPDELQHLFAILAALGDKPLTHIFVTHAHLDHSPLAKPLSEETGAVIVGFGDSRAGQSPAMRALAADGDSGGGEGVDHAFVPQIRMADGDVISGPDWQLRAIHTPGHMGNHLCFAWQDVVFTGDHVMGWASSMVSPPDGDVADFMASCRKLQDVPASVFYPGHGAPVTDPAARLDWLIAHREDRMAQIIQWLAVGPADVMSLTKRIYADAPPDLHRAAARNVFAHLVDLHGKGRVRADPTLSAKARFTLEGTP